MAVRNKELAFFETGTHYVATLVSNSQRLTCPGLPTAGIKGNKELKN